MKYKKEKLDRIAENLKLFYTELHHKFLCPTCLDLIDLSELSQITDAHIIPRAAGGNVKTFLCRNCNSKFGSSQDKWFGEYLRLKLNNQNVFQTKHQKGRFKFNDVPFTGEFRFSPERGFEACIFDKHSPPKSLKQLPNISSELSKSEVSFEVSIPLLENSHLISIGFLTAAYVLWFKTIGYSWVLQEHLDLVRKQIVNPKDEILDKRFIAKSSKTFKCPWTGMGLINSTPALLAGIYDKVIIFPTYKTNNFYERIPENSNNMGLSDIKLLQLEKAKKSLPPMGVMYGQDLLVLPDPMASERIETHILYYPRNDEPPRWLHPIDNEVADKLVEEGKAVPSKVNQRIEAPDKEIGSEHLKTD